VAGGLRALVDAADAPKAAAYKWHAKRKKANPGYLYAQTTIRLGSGIQGRKTTLAMHRHLVDAAPGAIIIDHKNGDGLDNRRENLRATSFRGNATNVTASKNKKRGGFKGVTWNQTSGKWQASICAGEVRSNGKRKQIYLGVFIDPADAARAYDAEALKHFGEYAALNFPDAGPQEERRSA